MNVFVSHIAIIVDVIILFFRNLNVLFFLSCLPATLGIVFISLSLHKLLIRIELPILEIYLH